MQSLWIVRGLSARNLTAWTVALAAWLAASPANLFAGQPQANVQRSESATRGRALFAERSCAACHAVNGESQSLAPDLSKLEQPLTRETLTEALSEPDKDIREGYETWVALTADGQVMSGRLISQNDDEVKMFVTDENQVKEITISRGDVEVLRKSTTSIMPRGLLMGMTDAQMTDLLAYLHSLPDGEAFGDVSIHPMVHGEHAGGNEFTPLDVRPGQVVFDQVDQEIVISTVPAQMRYDKAMIVARPGQRIKITLQNADDMDHNLLVTRGGRLGWLEVANLAAALGPDGPAKGYVPESDLILAATRTVGHMKTDSIYLQVPQEEGVYPFVCTMPGHAFLMRGEMLVTSRNFGLQDARFTYYQGNYSRLPNFERLEATATGVLEDNLFDIARRDRNDRFAFVFEGTLNTLAPGEYTFLLTSDDGSRMELDGRTIIDFDGIHPDGEQRTAKVQLSPGEHRLRLLYFEASGGEVLHAAWSGPDFGVIPLTKNTAPNVFRNLEMFQLKVENMARVVRVNMPDASSRAIAVGLPGGMNYCFDAETCEVRYGWTGGFLDVGPDRGYGRDRGGAVCNILGERFNVGAEGFPLRIGDSAEQPTPRFNGYVRNSVGPTFSYRLGELGVEQSVAASPSGRGLTYTFVLSEAPAADVRFIVAPAGLQLSSSAGQWQGGALAIPAAEAKNFTVTLEPVAQ